jgi:RNA polymerase sigma-70 factor (ECF subfamily)
MLWNRKTEIIDEDAGLLDSCRKGDLSAFEVLVRKYEKKIFNLAFRVVGEYEDAAEVSQDAFVAAYRSLDGFRGDSTFATWLTTITVNLARNRLKQSRTRRFREPCSLDDPLAGCGSCSIDPPSSGPSALQQLEREELRQRVRGCIGALEPGFREVLVLRDLEEHSYGEIGSLLNLAEGTVKSRLSRAREAVRDCLKRVAGEW